MEEYVPNMLSIRTCKILTCCFISGGDFQIATDGNFHHRHLVSGGESIRFHEPKHIVPKAFVDEVGEIIRKARKSPPNTQSPKVPGSAIDECEKSHDATDGDKKSVTSEGRYDDMGWMSLICCHDIPLFLQISILLESSRNTP